MNHLALHNNLRKAQIETYINQRVASHASAELPRFEEYPLPKLKQCITHALSERWGKGDLDVRFDLIERDRFGGDLSLKLPQLLADGGPKAFALHHVPWIAEVLTSAQFSGVIKNVETKGMYINLTVSDRWLLEGAQFVVDMGERYGWSDAMASRRIVVDYSSPNVAKVLHAGHIRSTIIGHVLANLYEACGALVYRVNHINDFGGFGFILEGYRRFHDRFPPEYTQNDKLLAIYSIRRTVEHILQNAIPLEDLSDSERKLLFKYFPNVQSTEQLATAFESFVAASDRRFAQLEAGSLDEVELWGMAIEWSLADFSMFYRALNIDFDLVVGESFYFDSGTEVVEDSINNGSAVVFTADLAECEKDSLRSAQATGQLSESELAVGEKATDKDVGAVVVPLGNGERFVVLRADGRSIYATRDLGAIKLRREMFDPTDIIYVVGQEQKVHFKRLFESAYRLGLANPESLNLQHLYFGFYVDARTGKKLSSRDTVANVNDLLTKSIGYFRSRLSSRVDRAAAEVDKSASELAVGSLVFNDLAQDIKGSVAIDTENVNATIERFERSGGAYVVYSACRARGILRKYGATPPRAKDFRDSIIDDQEAALLLKLQDLPEKTINSAEQSNPSTLVRHLLDTATIYNSYYSRAEVITNGVANPSRLLITQATQQALINGLKLCHIECPEAI